MTISIWTTAGRSHGKFGDLLAEVKAVTGGSED
jgi:hypothetical protein